MNRLLVFITFAAITLGSISFIQRLETDKELAAQKQLTTRWMDAANSCSAARSALETQAQSCLDRESRNNADAGLWLEIITEATARDLKDSEKRKVPDDKTRRNLLDALDLPL